MTEPVRYFEIDGRLVCCPPEAEVDAMEALALIDQRASQKPVEDTTRK